MMNAYEVDTDKPQEGKKCCCTGAVKAVFILLLLLVVLVVTAYLVTHLYPYTIKPVPFKLPDPPIINDLPVKYQSIKKTSTFLKDKVNSGESIQVIKEDVYTGLVNGDLVRMNNFVKGQAQVKTVASKLGRPLGLRHHPVTGELLAVSSGKGIMAVSVNNGSTRNLLPDKTSEAPFYMLNDMDITADGRYIFFTDFGRTEKVHLICLECNPNGRLLMLDTENNTLSVVLRGSTTNGVQLHTDKKSVLVSEMCRARILRYYFEGPRAGQKEIFAENLPGLPDNIRTSVQGGYWVGFALTRLNDADHYNFYDSWGKYTRIRQLMSWFSVPWIMGKIFKGQDGSAARLDEQGRIVQLIRDESQKVVNHITQVTELANGTLLFGTYANKYTQRIDKILIGK